MNEILVVDDEQQILVALQETLKRKGYTVSTASSAVEALRKLENRFYRAVITDVRMPELDGMELLKEVKRLSPGTPVILLTGHGTVNHGAFDYLMKPFSAERLTEVMERATSLVWRSDKPRSHNIITCDPKMEEVLALAEQASQMDFTVLIEAESGTGKELLARYIHNCSRRSGKAFIGVNCAALPEDLLESELFGYEKGAFTGANHRKPGKFELADGGTILLDEIGEMAPLLQAKLLRVLQEKEVDRVGGWKPTPIDVRVIATTNRNLRELVSDRRFREDLYYRLNVIPLGLPALRHRKRDISLLVGHFCEKYEQGNGKRFSDDTLELLQSYDWPGNVRELENVTRRAFALCRSPVISSTDLFLQEEVLGPSLELKPGVSLKELEREMIRVTLHETRSNRTQAAKMLGISLRTLRNKLSEYREAGITL